MEQTSPEVMPATPVVQPTQSTGGNNWRDKLNGITSQQWIIIAAVAVTVLAILVVGLLWWRNVQATNKVIATAQNHYNRAEYKRVESVLTELLADKPKNARALALLALSYASEGKSGEALKYYQASIDAEPRQPETLYQFASYQRLLGDSVAAERNFREAVRLEPDNTRYIDDLCRTLVSLGRYTEAAEYWIGVGEDGNQDKTTRVTAYLSAAQAYEMARATADAEKTIKAALVLDPKNAQAKAMLKQVRSQ